MPWWYSFYSLPINFLKLNKQKIFDRNFSLLSATLKSSRTCGPAPTEILHQVQLYRTKGLYMFTKSGNFWAEWCGVTPIWWGELKAFLWLLWRNTTLIQIKSAGTCSINVQTWWPPCSAWGPPGVFPAAAGHWPGLNELLQILGTPDEKQKAIM